MAQSAARRERERREFERDAQAYAIKLRAGTTPAERAARLDDYIMGERSMMTLSYTMRLELAALTILRGEVN